MQQSDTISAIATAHGEGGIGIIRISGEKAVEVADRVFRAKNGKRLAEAGSFRAWYGEILREDGTLVDEAIALVMRSPHSYTREDVVELQCHGGMLPLREVLSLTYRGGARPAERGEFTKRAFLNGRLDLSQAQAVMDVIGAKTRRSLDMAAGHLAGRLSGKVRGMREKLLGMIAHLEAAIDFPEDGVADVSWEETRGRIAGIRAAAQELLGTAHAGRILHDGLETAIIGKPNVGKSSLLNALLGEQRAIVTDVPGTTRDGIEEYAELGGIPVRLVDTAGIRMTEDAVEKIGVERAREYAEKAELLLAVLDGSRGLDAEDREILGLLAGRESIVLLNKADLPRAIDEKAVRALAGEGVPILWVSARLGTGLDALGETVSRLAYGRALAAPPEAGLLVSHERDVYSLRQADGHLASAECAIADGLGEDFVVIDLRSAWEKLGEITGDTVGEDIIHEIFSRFCLGK